MPDNITHILLGVVSFLFLAAIIKVSRETRKNKKLTGDINNLESVISANAESIDIQKQKLTILETEIEKLDKYKHIVDTEAEIENQKRIFSEQKKSAIAKLQKQLDEANEKIRLRFEHAQKEMEHAAAEKERITKAANDELRNRMEQGRQIVEQAELENGRIIQKAKDELQYRREQGLKIIEHADLEKQRIIMKAEEDARKIAGKAYDAAKREGELQAAIKAIENSITGYNDTYLIPAESLLDELASQYDFKEAGQELKKARDKIRTMIKTQIAATCDYVEAKRREYAIRFVLDAFNGKVDSVMAKLRHDNYGILKQQIIDGFSIVNNSGSAFRNARITHEYLEAVLDELKWAIATTELVRQDREEQRRIKQEMQEEVRAQREYEKAIKAAEKEEKLIQDAMEKARQRIAEATEEQRAGYEAQLKELEGKLKIAEEKNQRAISMAQQTRQGHVYVISNIGSFGENVLKIGMTRRLEPIDRVKELGDASVPFPFDVHAMIFSEDAPSLETQLHQSFSAHQVNKVNPRKEFFNLGVGTIREFVQELGVETNWTIRSEAMEYRESKEMAKRQGATKVFDIQSSPVNNQLKSMDQYLAVQ